MISDAVPIKLAQLLLRVVEAQGFDVKEFLLNHGLDQQLASSESDLPSHISAEQYNRLYTSITGLLQDECFGLHLKAKIPSGTFRMMCLTIIHCKDLGSAIERAEEFMVFCRNLCQMPVLKHQPIIHLDEQHVINILPDAGSIARNKKLSHDSDIQNLVAIAASLHMWRMFCSWLIGQPVELTGVYFCEPQPAKTVLLEQLFDCPLHFNQAYNGLCYHRQLLELPLIHNEESLNNFLKTAPYQLSVKHSSNSDIEKRIRSLVGSDFSQPFPSIETIAEQLNISVRTLRRHLKQAGTSYQKLKDNTRLAAATAYLNRPGLTIQAIAALMGFDEPSAFHRAFKKWTGQTPGQYRKALAKQYH